MGKSTTCRRTGRLGIRRIFGDTAGIGVTFLIYDSHKRKAGEVAGTNKGGKAEAEWVVQDIRDDDEKDELTYTFIATALRCKEVKSSSVAVKNPQIVEMKWDPESIYDGEETKLKITSFEVAAESPGITIQLYADKEHTILVHEEMVTIDKDDIEIPIELKLNEEQTIAFNGLQEINAETKVSCEAMNIKSIKSSPLWISLRDMRR